MIFRRILKGMYSQVLLFMAIYMMMLTAVAQEECDSNSRWNCPCAGGTRREHREHKRTQILVNTASQARKMTADLLSKLVEEHFQGNNHHVSELRRCIHGRHHDPTCLGLFLEQCDLDGLPQVERRLNPSEIQTLQIETRELLLQARDTMTRLAMFVKHSRTEEDRRPFSQSFRNQIRAIEENGIYHLLCNLQQAFESYSISWSPGIESDVTSECRYFEGMAPKDNRNYMVFYTLENALHNIAHKLQRLNMLNQR